MLFSLRFGGRFMTCCHSEGSSTEERWKDFFSVSDLIAFTLIHRLGCSICVDVHERNTRESNICQRIAWNCKHKLHRAVECRSSDSIYHDKQIPVSKFDLGLTTETDAQKFCCINSSKKPFCFEVDDHCRKTAFDDLQLINRNRIAKSFVAEKSQSILSSELFPVCSARNVISSENNKLQSCHTSLNNDKGQRELLHYQNLHSKCRLLRNSSSSSSQGLPVSIVGEEITAIANVLLILLVELSSSIRVLQTLSNPSIYKFEVVQTI